MSQNAKGPAEAATSNRASSINPTKDQKMNKVGNTTACGVPASARLLKDEIADQYIRIGSRLDILQHKAMFLMVQMEELLNRDRGEVSGSSVTLIFGKDTLDAMQWLAGEVWSDCSILNERKDALRVHLDDLYDLPELGDVTVRVTA